LLAIPGASAYLIGDGVVYTRQSRTELLGITEAEIAGITPSTEPHALLFARKVRGKLTTQWRSARPAAPAQRLRRRRPLAAALLAGRLNGAAASEGTA
jgi:hypothetical protein